LWLFLSMQNYIPFKELIKQLFEKTFFIVHSGSREYLVPSSVISEEKDKFYRLEDVSDAISSSIVYQKEETGTIAYVDLRSVKAYLLNKSVTIDQVLTDLEATLVGVLFKDLVDTAIAITNKIGNTEENQIGELNPIHTEESTVNPSQPKPSEPQNTQTNQSENKNTNNDNTQQTKNSNNRSNGNYKKYYNNSGKTYNNSRKGYAKSYHRNYKTTNKSDK